MRRRTEEQRDRDLTWVLVCTNERNSEHPACANAGSEEVLEAVKRWLRDHDLFWSDVAVVETSSCLGLCSEEGTAVAFQPNDEWFSDVTPEQVPELLVSELSIPTSAGDGSGLGGHASTSDQRRTSNGQ